MTEQRCVWCGGKLKKHETREGIYNCVKCFAEFITEEQLQTQRQFYAAHTTKNEPERFKKIQIPDSFKWAVWERDNFTCKHCGSRRNLSVDHIFPESMGGELTMDNAQTLCRSCNSRKGAR